MNYEEILHKTKNNQDINMTVDSTTENQEHKDIYVPPTGTLEQSHLQKELLDYVAHSKAIFKSQQKDDPELSIEEKRKIATDTFNESHSVFLSKFGRFMKKEHLSFFDDEKEEDYEVSYHLEKLQRFHDSSTRQIDIKNRRYQALKSMIDKGDYFSESEMMKRNPLLYDHLVGRYLTEEQKKARDNLDTQNITFVNLLLESIERDGTRNLKKEQQDAEEGATEEVESEDDSDDCSNDLPSTSRASGYSTKWGEMSDQTKDPYEKEEKERRMDIFWQDIPSKEKQILKEEFVTNMYQHFLDGKDTDFDYSTVDDNEVYDNVDLRTQDEEEKYFDSESPQTLNLENGEGQDESEDELDKYMRLLQEQPTPNVLAKETKEQTL